VCLVYNAVGKPLGRSSGSHFSQGIAKFLDHKSLWRYERKLELPILETLNASSLLVSLKGRIYKGCGVDARFFEMIVLVVHQRLDRIDNQCNARL